MNEKTVLIVDDLQGNRKALIRIMRDEFGNFLEAENGAKAIAILEENRNVDLVLLDLMMPVMDGLGFLRAIQPMELETPILVLSANQDLKIAVEAMKLGAKDYFEKPFETELLINRIRTLCSERQLKKENNRLRQVISRLPDPYSMLGSTEDMASIQIVIQKVARNPVTVLVTGETGTGKEMVARAIHYRGNRALEPFMVVDCGSIGPTIIESELFGHEKGAFTGALGKKTGMLLAAGKGTVFFDEIGELPLDLQAKLLRVIQEKEVRPMGMSQYFPVEARIVAATNRDLPSEVAKGTFREDLYYRLNVVNIHLPPLRNRKQDIPQLAEFLLQKYAAAAGCLKSLTPAAITELCARSWKGNIRELENTLQKAVALSDGEEIDLADLGGAARPAKDAQIPSVLTDTLMTLESYEKHAIEKALQITNGNRKAAADLIGIGEATLYRKLKEFQEKEAGR